MEKIYLETIVEGLTEKDFDTLLKVLNSYFVAVFDTVMAIENAPVPNIPAISDNSDETKKEMLRIKEDVLRQKRGELEELDKVKSKLYYLKELMLDQKGELSVEDILGNDLKGKG